MSDKKVVHISGSSVNTVSNCVRKFVYEYKECLHPMMKAETLEKGDLVHRMLERHYNLVKDGKPYPEIIQEVLTHGRMQSLDLDIPVDVVEETCQAYMGYAQFWNGDGWTPVYVEQPFTKLLYEDEGFQVFYEGRIDLVADTKQGLVIVDHKSSARNQTPSPLSNQFMGYAWALDVKNVIVNRVGFQKTLPSDKKFVRHAMSYTSAVLEEWRKATVYRALEIVHALELEGEAPPNYTSCDKYGGCIFAELCSTDPETREWKKANLFKRGESHDPWRV